METIDFLITAGCILFVAIAIRKARRRSAPTKQNQARPTPKRRQHPPVRLAPQPKPFDPTQSKPQEGTQIIEGPAWVIDGDSIVVKKTQIRLFGVDAPELDHPYGKKAKWALAKLCKGKPVRAEIIARDTHDRTVALCTLPDGRDLSAEMVRLGLAIDWPKYSGGKYRAMETGDARKKLWLADARQKGRMHVWEKYEARKGAAKTTRS